MVSLLATFGIAGMIVLGGTLVSLFLYVQGFSEDKRIRHVRRLHIAHAAEHPFLTDTNIDVTGSEMTQYARRALVALIVALIVLALIAFSMVHAFIR